MFDLSVQLKIEKQTAFLLLEIGSLFFINGDIYIKLTPQIARRMKDSTNQEIMQHQSVYLLSVIKVTEIGSHYHENEHRDDVFEGADLIAPNKDRKYEVVYCREHPTLHDGDIVTMIEYQSNNILFRENDKSLHSLMVDDQYVILDTRLID